MNSDRIRHARLHVTLVSTQRQSHGGEVQAGLLASGLRERGHRCTVLARRGSEFARQLSADGFDVRTFPGRGRSPWGIWRLHQHLDALRRDVLHHNDPHALTSAGFAAVDLPIDARVVARRVDFPVKSPGRYLRLADGVFCVSHAVADACRQAGIPETHLQLVHDGVDPRFAESGNRLRGCQQLQVTDRQPLLLTVAKLTDHKGHEFLLRAMPSVITRYPNVRLILAGDGELRESLERLTQQLGIERCVRFLGFRRDIADLLAAADLVVQPSHMEGLCSSLIDAMFAERPIVATRAGGIPDLVDATEAGGPVAWLCPPREPDPLAEAILAALADSDERCRRGQRARLRALRHFTADAMVEATVAAYRRIATGLLKSRVFESSAL